MCLGRDRTLFRVRRRIGFQNPGFENLKAMSGDSSKLEEALEVFTRSREIRQELVDQEPGNHAHRRDLSIACYWCGRVRRQSGAEHRESALRDLHVARALAKDVLDANHWVADMKEKLGNIDEELRLLT